MFLIIDLLPNKEKTVLTFSIKQNDTLTEECLLGRVGFPLDMAEQLPPGHQSNWESKSVLQFVLTLLLQVSHFLQHQGHAVPKLLEFGCRDLKAVC